MLGKIGCSQKITTCSGDSVKYIDSGNKLPGCDITLWTMWGLMLSFSKIGAALTLDSKGSHPRVPYYIFMCLAASSDDSTDHLDRFQGFLLVLGAVACFQSCIGDLRRLSLSIIVCRSRNRRCLSFIGLVCWVFWRLDLLAWISPVAHSK